MKRKNIIFVFFIVISLILAVSVPLHIDGRQLHGVSNLDYTQEGNEIVLTWDSVGEEDYYVIFRDGEFVGHSEDTTYSESLVGNGNEYKVAGVLDGEIGEFEKVTFIPMGEIEVDITIDDAYINEDYEVVVTGWVTNEEGLNIRDFEMDVMSEHGSPGAMWGDHIRRLDQAAMHPILNIIEGGESMPFEVQLPPIEDPDYDEGDTGIPTPTTIEKRDINWEVISLNSTEESTSRDFAEIEVEESKDDGKLVLSGTVKDISDVNGDFTEISIIVPFYDEDGNIVAVRGDTIEYSEGSEFFIEVDDYIFEGDNLIPIVELVEEYEFIVERR